MMDGRVKTLHPALHGGILARRDRPDDLAALERPGHRPHRSSSSSICIRSSKAAANPDDAVRELVEEIDIGGPSMVRAAAKNFRDVLVVVDPADYPRLLDGARRGPEPRVSLRADAQGVRAHRGVRHRRSLRTLVHGRRRRRSVRATRRQSAAPLGRPPRAVARRRSAICATARTRISRRLVSPARASPDGGRDAGLGDARRCSGQGAVVHEPARPRCRRADRARVRRAGGGRRQAHEPVRRRHGRIGRRRVRARARGRQPGGVRRHRRAQPAARRRGGRSHRRRRSSKR